MMTQEQLKMWKALSSQLREAIVLAYVCDNVRYVGDPVHWFKTITNHGTMNDDIKTELMGYILAGIRNDETDQHTP